MNSVIQFVYIRSLVVAYEGANQFISYYVQNRVSQELVDPIPLNYRSEFAWADELEDAPFEWERPYNPIQFQIQRELSLPDRGRFEFDPLPYQNEN